MEHKWWYVYHFSGGGGGGFCLGGSAPELGPKGEDGSAKGARGTRCGEYITYN